MQSNVSTTHFVFRKICRFLQTTPVIRHSLQPPPLQNGHVARTLGEFRVRNGTKCASRSSRRLRRATPSRDADIERARFENFDSDNTGLLERGEIHAMMVQMGVECDPEYVNAVLSKFDLDGDGSIDLKNLFWTEH